MRTKILLLILLFFTVNASSQEKKVKMIVTGTVMDGSGNPVVGATVLKDGKNTSSRTNSKGEYTIRINKKTATIGIFSIGHGIIEQAVEGRSEINFKYSVTGTLKQDLQNTDPGEESVNTGYGQVKKKNLTTTVNKIDGTNKKYASYSSIQEMILREVPGVRIISGGAIVIQDSKNLYGAIPALIIVNGVPVTTLENIPPSTVESIEVLKGTSAAIYGSRGYGGVILIKTKIEN
jgi:TonB-dependent SusC/RagA subfamily outer membrane receptor